ncbi:hypothetical protein BVX95_00670 [archaeon D22]|nr:hypothetical protein BVX95_00670 [archaeon D22]
MDLITIMNELFQPGTTLTTGEILGSLLLTLVLSVFIFFVYKKTYDGVIYSRDFNITLVIISLVITVIMLGISRNLVLSLGLVGALSIVRFRNAIKDSKDVAFLFWAITVGIVNGVQMYKLSIFSVIFISIVLFLISKKIPIKAGNYVLVLKSKGNKSEKEVEKILDKFTKKFHLRSSLFTKENNEYVYEIRIIKKSETLLMRYLNKIEAMESINLISHTGDIVE